MEESEELFLEFMENLKEIYTNPEMKEALTSALEDDSGVTMLIYAVPGILDEDEEIIADVFAFLMTTLKLTTIGLLEQSNFDFKSPKLMQAMRALFKHSPELRASFTVQESVLFIDMLLDPEIVTRLCILDQITGSFFLWLLLKDHLEKDVKIIDKESK